MGKKEQVKIVILSGDYYSTYAPFTGNKEEDDRKVKRGMLKYSGMKDEEIEKIIDSLEIEMDYGGADGMFDDGPLTPIRLVKNIGIEPPPPPPLPPQPSQPELEKEEAREPRITMLQQYYGDRDAERRRIKTFDRFKSHITKKNINTYDLEGKERKIEVYTVEDYEGKSKDSDELLLDGYQTRLERLSRAHQKDFSPYEREFQRLKTLANVEILEKYEEMHKIKPEEAEELKKKTKETMKELDTPEFKKSVIQALIDQDTEFIETNNYTYNSRQNTAENLKTLGKDGEKSVKAPISDEQNAFEKLGLKTMNTLITIRNYTKAPVNKAIGTYVASPIYRALMRVTQAKSKEPVTVDGYKITPMEDILATSQKNSRGMFKNKPSHRYHARKDLFIEEEKRELMEKLQQNGKQPRVTLGSLVKLAIVPRIRAITEYKNGNVSILNAGLYDIEEATRERNSQMIHKRNTIISSMNRISSYEDEIEELKALQKVVKNPEEKEKMDAIIKQRELWKAKLEGRLIEAERTEIDSISTDAVSMSQHDKANKARMTTVVRGVKTAARVATGTFISKYLYHEVLKKGRTSDTRRWIPGEEVEKEVTDTVIKTVPGMDETDVGKITLEDIYAKGSGMLTYDAYGGNKIGDNSSYFRGLAFEYQGKLFSGSDGKGFDPTVLTDVKLDQAIDGDTRMVSLVQEILQDKLGKTFSEKEINNLIIDGQIKNFDVWRSSKDRGIPDGWLDASEIVPDIISSGTHEIRKTITKTIIETTPGRWEIIPGEDYFYKVTELNPAVLAAEMGLAASEIADINEFLRYTRGQENIQIRSSKILKLMAIENQKKREANKENTNGKIQGTSEKDVHKTEIRRNIKSFQRTNKSKFRFYAYESERMKTLSEYEAKKRKGVTVFEKFTGTKKEDFASGYDENLIGANDKEKPIDYERD